MQTGFREVIGSSECGFNGGYAWTSQNTIYIPDSVRARHSDALRACRQIMIPNCDTL
jgi:hypothetical protein